MSSSLNPDPNIDDPIIYRSQLQQFIDLSSINSTNKNLILQLVQPNSLHLSFLKIVSSLALYTNLEFYTDGSL
ncbi:hypothetical protein RhiirC2_805137, partial [Rhizophagus irregularis]